MKQTCTFSDLDKHRQRVIVANSKTLAMALQLLEKAYGRQIVTKLIAQGNHAVRSMSSEELAEASSLIDEQIENDQKISDFKVFHFYSKASKR